MDFKYCFVMHDVLFNLRITVRRNNYSKYEYIPKVPLHINYFSIVDLTSYTHLGFIINETTDDHV